MPIEPRLIFPFPNDIVTQGFAVGKFVWHTVWIAIFLEILLYTEGNLRSTENNVFFLRFHNSFLQITIKPLGVMVGPIGVDRKETNDNALRENQISCKPAPRIAVAGAKIYRLTIRDISLISR